MNYFIKRSTREIASSSILSNPQGRRDGKYRQKSSTWFWLEIPEEDFNEKLEEEV